MQTNKGHHLRLLTLLPFFPFHHTLQLLTQRIPHPPLPLPLLTHPLHPTAGHDHEPHSPQGSSLLLRPANLAAQAVSKAETGGRGRRCDAHFGKEVEIDLVTVRRISVVFVGWKEASLPSLKHFNLHQ